jgi:hypothetical protein
MAGVCESRSIAGSRASRVPLRVYATVMTILPRAFPAPRGAGRTSACRGAVRHTRTPPSAESAPSSSDQDHQRSRETRKTGCTLSRPGESGDSGNSGTVQGGLFGLVRTVRVGPTCRFRAGVTAVLCQ